MNKVKTKLFSARLFVLFVVINFMLLIYLAKLSSPRASAARDVKQASKATPPRVNNKTAFFEATFLEIKGKQARLALKNNYSKTILSFSYAIPPNHGYVTVQHAILPGMILEEEVGIPDGLLTEDKELTILGVLFDDRSGDGDPVIIQELQDRDLGQRIQVKRINRIFKTFSDISEANLQTTLEEAKSKINRLEDPPEASRSFALRAALQDQKQIALSKIQELEQTYRERGFAIFQRRLQQTTGNYQTLSHVLSQ
jgi:hypothetical protein